MWQVRGKQEKIDLVDLRKNFQVRANTMIKKNSVKTFCCYDKKQQIRKFSWDFRVAPR